MGPKRSYAANAENGKVRVSFAKAAGRKTDYSGSAKNASPNMPTSVTSGSEKVGEDTSDMKIVIG
ncbi:MAG: hypothetical protein H8E73_10265 [Planctomycetes bacterium]|nr:hypothetical protein [Planctomycetota bacterium]